MDIDVCMARDIDACVARDSDACVARSVMECVARSVMECVARSVIECGDVSDGVCEKIRKIKIMAMDNDGVWRWTMMVCGDGQ